MGSFLAESRLNRFARLASDSPPWRRDTVAGAG